MLLLPPVCVAVLLAGPVSVLSNQNIIIINDWNMQYVNQWPQFCVHVFTQNIEIWLVKGFSLIFLWNKV